MVADLAVPWYAHGVIAGTVALLVGGGWLGLAPGHTARLTDRAIGLSAVALVVGLVVTLLAVGALAILHWLLGPAVARPLAVVAGGVVLVAGELGYLAAGRLLADRLFATDRRATVLAIAVGLSAVLALVPVVGHVGTIALSATGVGALLIEVVGR